MRRVERAAANAILRCVHAGKLTAIPLPIPVEAWIEGPLKIKFGFADLSSVGADCLAVARPKLREILISEALVNQEVRFRFTAAHELGHVLLHARLGDEFRESPDRDYVERRIEREADRFAAAFLMPLSIVCKEMTRACQSHGNQPDVLLARIRNGEADSRALFGSVILPHLSRRFGVSLSAAAYRFADANTASGESALPLDVCRSFLPAHLAKEVVRRDGP